MLYAHNIHAARSPVVGHGDHDNNHDYDELEANIMMIMMMMKTTYLKPHCWKWTQRPRQGKRPRSQADSQAWYLHDNCHDIIIIMMIGYDDDDDDDDRRSRAQLYPRGKLEFSQNIPSAPPGFDIQ